MGVGHPKIWVVRRISGRTFKIQKNGSSGNFGGTSNFRSNVQNSKTRVIRRFRWYVEFPVERSKFKKTGHPKISVVRRISGRTFKIQKNGSSENCGGTSNFRSNVQNSKNGSSKKFGGTSNFRSNV